MVSDEGRVKVLDFGLAKLEARESGSEAADEQTAPITDSGQLPGTLHYMSPERLRGEPVDTRSDIFAFGVMLFEMATGVRPFRGVTRAEIFSAILRDEPASLTSVRGDLPARLDRIIRHCLVKDPRRRQQSALDLRRELEDLGRQTSAQEPPTIEAPRGRRARGIQAAAVVVAVLAAAFAGRRLWSPTPPQARTAPIRSLAVLPFENLMKDPEQDYFVEGMHEAVLTELARLGDPRVTSRTSVMRYREERRPVRDVARELGVDAVVEGTVLRSGDRVRITAQLVRGATDEHVWARHYDRDLRDVLALLSEVSGAIAAEIHETVAEDRGERSSQGTRSTPRPVEPDAYEAYLLAQHAARPFSRQGLEKALTLYRKATALDSSFAPPWGGIALARVVQATHQYAVTREALPEAREAARRALDLDGGLSSAHCAQGLIALYYDWDLEAARRTLEHAVALNPSDSCLRQAYADSLLLSGKGEEGLEQGRVGRQFDPLWPTAHYLVLYHLICAGRYDETIAEGRRMLEAFPGTNIAHWPIGLALWLKGRPQDALLEWRARFDADQESRAEWEARFGAGDECFRGLEAGYRGGGPRVGLRTLADCTAAKATKGEVLAFEPAAWYAASGHSDPAFEWLEQSYARREPALLFVAVNPLFEPIRSDLRYETLLRRIRIPRRAPSNPSPL
jgi:TolB-like protein